MLCIGVIVISNAQGEKESSYEMYALHHITIKQGKAEAALKKMKEHDAKFHEGKGYVGTILNGKNAGDVYWTYGPMTFTAMDEYKLPEGHSADNNQIEAEYFEEYHSLNFWKNNIDLSNHYPDKELGNMRLFEYIKLNSGKYEDFSGLIKKHLEVYKKNNLESFYFYSNPFPNKDGYNHMLVIPFAKMAFFDEENKEYKSQFEAIHGEGSLKKAGEEWNNCVEGIYVELVAFPPQEKK